MCHYVVNNIVCTRIEVYQLLAFIKNFSMQLLLLSAILLSHSACAEKKFRLVTTFTIIQDIAQNVTGDAAVVESITKPGAEIHNYQPTPRSIMKAQHADLILWNGMDLEHWFRRFFENIKHVPAVFVTEGITQLPIRHDPYHKSPNPHAWMSPRNAIVYIENIRKALVQYDPINTATYNRNAQAYTNKILALDALLRERLSHIPEGHRWLVTSEGAFSYLAKDYQFKECYLWPINADEQGSPQQIRRVVDTVRNYHIPVVFSESTISDKPVKQVAKETGTKYGGVLYIDSLSTKEGPVPSYIDLLRVTVDTIAKGFNQ